ncbi:MAG: sugar kinase [Acidimicrobiia bacterium]
MSHDLYTFGEAMLRLWVPAGERLEDAAAYRVTVAGAEANVAMAVARAGKRAAWVSRLPDTPLGRRAAREIAGHGVDVSAVRWVADARMGTYFVELSVPPRPVSVVYDRRGSAAAAITAEDIDWKSLESARVVHLTGITPALSDSARATTIEAAHRAQKAGAVVTFDINYRASLWSIEQARETLLEICAAASVVITTAEDAGDLFGVGGDAAEVADTVKELSAAGAAVVTAGAGGAAWRGELGSGSLPGHPATTLDRIGSGDAFAAGVVLGLLDDDLTQGVRLGLAMAAVKLGIHGDQLISYPDEIAALIERRNGREVQR